MSHEVSPSTGVERWTFGEAPLAETVELAAVLRDLMGTALALEQPSEELARAHRRARRRPTAPRRAAAGRPRARASAGRAGGASASTSTTRATSATTTRASRATSSTRTTTRAEGRVEFPLVYEGPPGVVHGGFLAVFFDCVLQQLNCDLGLAGKTRSLALRYRRPVPILTELQVVAHRTIADGTIQSQRRAPPRRHRAVRGRDVRGLGDRAALPVVSPRRPA